ncbi:MAG: 30S ribosomal protein S3ae [Candidatus Aenigmarchaeota archaeon]|nr:30S ribosomal protein S3ae [Candidatus Aenigmarchaeota archaeon]
MVKGKGKKKDWFVIVAPKMFGEKEIGKAMVSDPGSLMGRRVVLNLAELTNNFAKYYMKFAFRIKRIEGNRAFSEFDGSECLRDYISRMVLRRVKRIDAIQDLQTKDGIRIRVKSLMIASRRMKSSIEKKMRREIEEMIKKEVESSTLEDFVKKIINDKIKNKVLKEARKIYPVRNFEIRRTEVLQ